MPITLNDLREEIEDAIEKHGAEKQILLYGQDGEEILEPVVVVLCSRECDAVELD